MNDRFPAITDRDTGLSFEWNESRTINVYYGGDNIDCVELEEDEPATYERFKERVAEYVCTEVTDAALESE